MTNLIGSVIYAWFPEQAHLMQPGSKFRPCLVVDIDHNSKTILLAYGTSQQTDRQDRGQFTIKKSEMQSLQKDTKFSMSNPLWVPMKTEFLSRNPSELHVQVVGQVPRSVAARLVRALEEVSRH